jgi:hypothetical protein
LDSFSPCRLVVEADALAVDALRRLGEGLIDQPPDNPPILEDEGRLVAPDLQHGAYTFAMDRAVAVACKHGLI